MDIQIRFDEVFHEIRPVLCGLDPSAFDRAVRAVLDARSVYVAGAGRSGLLMRMFAMRLVQAGLTVHVAGSATAPAIREGDLLVIASGSGSTATMQALADKARAANADVMLITYTTDSPIGSNAKEILALPVPRDPNRPGGVGGTQILGSLFDQALMFLCTLLIEAIAETSGQDNAAMQSRHANLE